MPASEQTWRNQKLLHRVFAASGVLLLVSTLWMLIADHNREWKNYQKTIRDAELTRVEWAQRTAKDEFDARSGRLTAALLEAQSQPIAPELVEQFKAEVKQAVELKILRASPSFSTIDAQLAEYNRLAGAAVAKRKQARDLQQSALQAQQEATAAQLAVQAAQAKLAAAQGDDVKKAAQGELDFARKQADEAVARPKQFAGQIAAARKDAVAAEHDAAEQRDALKSSLQSILSEARFREEYLLGRRKFRAADLDATRARLDIAVRDELTPAQQERIENEVDAIIEGAPDNSQDDRALANLTLAYEFASTYRSNLEDTLKAITAEEDLAQKNLDDAAAELRLLEQTKIERRATWFELAGGWFPWPGKKWLELPILDAFNSPLKIDNLWHDGNKIDYNFSDVRRFDRCTTCHQSIQRTLPGSSVDPAYAHERSFDLILRTPTREELAKLTAGKTPSLANVYGFELAEQGLFEPNDITVQYVRPATEEDPLAALAAQARLAGDEQPPRTGAELRAAMFQAHAAHPATGERPGLMSGDVIEKVNGNQIYGGGEVYKFLIDAVQWGQPVRITVKRGAAHPYASHPRLDLFVGSTSPHDMAKFACTICHEGQGSATAFKFASHSPSTPLQANQWGLDHGWFDNHHWIFPMFPQRFAESSCLKCHHDVHELEGRLISADGGDATGRLVDPPAPKLMHGYNLIRKYGCFGCHEVNGQGGGGKRVGPDMRLEPNVSEAVQQLMTDGGFASLDEQAQSWALQLKLHPELDEVRHRLLEVVAADAAEAKREGGRPKLSAMSHKVGELLKDVETPGELRKVGPSLRRVGHKLTPEFMYDWVRQPSHFRPDTRMPQFFGLWSHLELAEADEKSGEKAVAGQQDTENASGAADVKLAKKDQSLELSKRYEPIEILGIVRYLRQRTQEFPYSEAPAGVAMRPLEERVTNGKVLFESRGCLACHTHKAFPEAEAYRTPGEIVQGPDLSAVADKFSPEKNPRGPEWLQSWIRDPSRYSPRTLMPDLKLDPYDVPVKDEQGQPRLDEAGKPLVTHIDPIGDIVEFLLAESRTNWEPKLEADVISLDPRAGLVLDDAGRKTLDELVRKGLEDVYFKPRVDEIMKDGIKENLRGDIKGAEIELVGDSITEQMKLLYVGNKTIARYGCYGCHDIPGFEDAKPIGTGLADWGRKDPARLAFEHITEYLKEAKHHAGHAHGDASAHGGASAHGKAPTRAAGTPPGESAATEYQAQVAADVPASGQLGEDDLEFYEQALEHGNRTGFIWQKLKEPRSYDFKKTQYKKYSERLRMPQFPFSEVEREDVITFVLGLVADPPEATYIYRPSPRQEAILAGRAVAEKYNCAGCHMFELEKWDLAYAPGRFGEQVKVQTFPFMDAHFTSQELEASTRIDRSGLRHATVVGLPTISDTDALPIINDFEGDPLSPGDSYDPASVQYLFDLWKPVPLDGQPYQVAVLPLKLSNDVVTRKSPTDGGFLAKYLAPRVVARAKQAPGVTVKGTEVWGWVPPPLMGQGEKVQTDWLHDFLLDPHAIRPEVVLRMPKFNMSSDEASRLVDYFAAKDNVTYPYDFSPRRRSDYIAEQQQKYEQLLAELKLPSSTRFDDARQIVFNKAGCIQCHQVGDYRLGPRGPDLAAVYKRLRGDFTRRWVANPKRLLPYTSMPENFKYSPDTPDEEGFIATKMEGGETKKNKLVHGTATEQLDAMIDLLLNFDLDAQQRSPYAVLAPKDVVPPPGAAPPPATSGETTSGEAGGGSP